MKLTLKYPVSVIGALCLSLHLFSQSGTTTPFSALPSVTINLKEPGPISGTVFRHFEVIDQRSDTTRIGVHTFWPTFGHPRDRQLTFHSPASTEIAGYLNTWFTRPDAPFTALVVLRSLWLSDASYLREEVKKDPNKLYERTHIRFKAEIYAVRDSQYMPIFRFDTLQAYKNSNLYRSVTTFYDLWDRDLTAIVATMADSASLLTAVKVGHARLLHLEDILEFNRTRFYTPISNNASLTPGVYVSFEEFRNNAPSIRDFEIKKENNTRVLYIKEAGGSSWYYSHDVWGYCDGKAIYVMRDGILRQAWKEGNAYYFYGNADKQLAIDMDTGGVY